MAIIILVIFNNIGGKIHVNIQIGQNRPKSVLKSIEMWFGNDRQIYICTGSTRVEIFQKVLGGYFDSQCSVIVLHARVRARLCMCEEMNVVCRKKSMSW